MNIKGGVINTNKAQGQILGDVNIESLQDTATYDSNQNNIGFTADIALEGAGSSLSVNGGKTDINADYKAVGQQSGIFTGDGGFDVTVDGKTDLIGGAITTTDAALAAGLNNYVSKGGITTRDIENTSSYKGSAIQVGISLGMTDNKPQGNTNGLGYGTDSDSDSSTTRAGITGIAGNSGITTDNQAEYAGALENVFDATRVNEELGAQTIITKEFGKEAPKAVAEFAKDRMDAIKKDPTLTMDEKLAEIKKWDEGGVYRVAAHTAVGAFGTGSLEGALTTGGVAAAAPVISDLEQKMADKLVEQGMSADIAQSTANAITSVAIVGAGTAAGLDVSSAGMAANVDANNRQLHPEKGEYWVVDQLYKAQGNKKKWTREQIANALRSADFKKGSFTEDDDSNTVVNLSNGEPKNYIDYENGAKWKNTGGGLILPVDRNIDPMLGAWIRQVMSQDQDFKSYNYKWDSQNLKGNKPLPSIVTPEKPKPVVKPKPVYQGSNPATKVTKQELDSRNQAVKNGADLRGGNSIQAASDKTLNEKVLPVAQTVTGAGEVVVGTGACVSGIGCPAGAVLIANGLDNMATGGSNYNKKPTEQVPSATLDKLGVPKETAGYIKLGADLSAGGAVANITKPKPSTTVNSAASKAEIDAQRIDNNVNADNDLISYEKNKELRDENLISNAENISTAKIPEQAIKPRDLQEQIAWNQVLENPQAGKNLDNMNYDNLTGKSDRRFPKDAGFQKMEASFERADNRNITIHYQYNKRTGKVYDMKITTEYMDGYKFPAQPQTPEKQK